MIGFFDTCGSVGAAPSWWVFGPPRAAALRADVHDRPHTAKGYDRTAIALAAHTNAVGLEVI